jgi:hypothetical protein
MDAKAVEVFQYNPFFGQDVSFGGVVVVGPGIEGFFPGLYNVDVTDTTITVLFTSSSAFGDGGPDPFPTGMNGVRVLDVNNTISAFTSVSLVSSTLAGFDASRLAFDANNIYLNFANLSVAPGVSVTAAVNAVSAIPEPELGVLLLAGIGLIGFVARRRKKALSAA